MVTSILSLNSDSEEKIKVNGYKFTKVNTGYMTYKDDKQIIVTNNPLELQSLEINKDILNLNNNLKIYLSVDSLLSARLKTAISGLFTSPITMAANTNEKSIEYNLPLKTCKDSTSTEGVITLVSTETNQLSFNDNCLELKGNDDYFIKVLEKLKLTSEGIL